MAERANASEPAVERPLALQWLSGIFARELSAETLGFYGSEEGKTLLALLDEEPAFRPLVARLRALAAEKDHMSGRILDLAGTYARLFLGVGGRNAAPPYASAYCDEKGRLFQQPTAAMAALLRRLDIAVAEGVSEPPDHIAIELAVLAEICARADAARRAGETETAERFECEAAAFANDYLLVWIPDFCSDCLRLDQSGFYASAAAALLRYVRLIPDLRSAPKMTA